MKNKFLLALLLTFCLSSFACAQTSVAVNNEKLQKKEQLEPLKSKRLAALQAGMDDYAEEREILTAFYKTTGGDNWINNENWCTDKPLSEWYGLTCSDVDGGVFYIVLRENNLQGSIPPEFFDLPNIQVCMLYYNNLGGELPKEVGNFRGHSLLLYGNQLTGEIPSEIANIENNNKESIEANEGRLVYSIDISDNNFEGGIPESLGTMLHCSSFRLQDNNLTGDIPESVQETEWFRRDWPYNLNQRGEGFKTDGLNLKCPKVNTVDCIGNPVTNESFAGNKYSILMFWQQDEIYSTPYMELLKDVYYDYKKKGLEIYSYSTYMTDENIAIFKSANQIPWIMFSGSGNFINPTHYPWVDIIDSEGNIVWNGRDNSLGNYSTQAEHVELIRAFLKEKLGEPDPMEREEVVVPGIYVSTDYSRDGKVTQIQQSTEGNGIDVVLMCDAFSDRMIADGTYEKAVNYGMEAFFEVEPFKSFRHLFNVYMVEAVSTHELVGGKTIFGSTVHGMQDSQKAVDYALKAIDEQRLKEAVIHVLINNGAPGEANMIYEENDNDYGSGMSISYSTFRSLDNQYDAHTVIHEACGHGFGKLMDEYNMMEEADEGMVEGFKQMQKKGWYKNIDFTADPEKVAWANFLKDERYVEAGLGIFEGAYFLHGAYRSTFNSVMRYQEEDWTFNAPSRETIYYRIHKLAYGRDWQYDRQKFIEWDVANNLNVNSEYNITYIVDGEIYFTETMNHGETVTPIAEPEKEGHTFSGWSEIPKTMPAHDVTVTGTFTVNKYMVRYYDGETLLAEFVVEYGAAIPQYEYNNEEYIFEGWDGETYETMPAHDIAYYAITKPNGIEAILMGDDAEITVYDLAGLAVYKGRKSGMPKHLKGLYIIKYGDKAIKCRL